MLLATQAPIGKSFGRSPRTVAEATVPAPGPPHVDTGRAGWSVGLMHHQIALVLTSLAVALLSGCGNTPSDSRSWPGAEWATSTPEAEGMDPALIQQALDYAFEAQHNTQGVVVVRNGVIVAQRYSEGRDAESLGTSWSMGKSVAGALIGLARDRGFIESIDQPAADYLPAWRGTPNASITIRDLLEMRSGLEWNEGRQNAMLYLDPVDQVAFSLALPLGPTPGTIFNYTSPNSMLLAAIASAAVGEPAREFAQRVLFEPIGMPAQWWIDGSGNTMGYCCLDARTRDYARFGLLFARGGAWRDNQVISSDWVMESTTPLEGAPFYGLQWWLNTNGMMIESAPDSLYAARGLHDQNIYVLPEEDLVVVRNGFYQRFGNGETIRTGSNIIFTRPANDWSDEDFIGPIIASLGQASAANRLDRTTTAADSTARAQAKAALESARLH